MAALIGNWWFSTPWDGMGLRTSDETGMWSFVGKKLNVFRTGMACCCVCQFHFEAFWAHVLANEAGSQRPGTQILDVTWWLNRLDPQKSMHPPFSDKFHLTISSPRSFADFFFPQATIFPKKSLKVDSNFSPSRWFSAKALVFHQKDLVFHDFQWFVSIFPAFSRRFSWFPGPRRGPRQGPGKGRRSRPSGRAASLGPWWGIGWLVVGGIWTIGGLIQIVGNDFSEVGD